jgi:hypothetical protein
LYKQRQEEYRLLLKGGCSDRSGFNPYTIIISVSPRLENLLVSNGNLGALDRIYGNFPEISLEASGLMDKKWNILKMCKV